MKYANIRASVSGKERLRQLLSAVGYTALLMACFPQPALANPGGGTVAAGTASIAQSGSTLTVDQKTKIVIINWKSFDIAAGETTRFDQPGSSSLAVNRIGGGDPAKILGSLIANGRVVLIDGNGILFGPNAKVNIGALIATTSDAADGDILSGRAKFDQAGDPNAHIVNNGSITAKSGMVGLIAPAVANNGVIQARLGQVALGASNVFTVDFTGDGLISFPVDPNIIAAAIDENGRPVSALVANNGRIEGRTVLLSARAAADLVTGVVSTGGTIVAREAHEKGGSIVLDGGQNAVDLEGTNLDASGAGGGGSITVGGWRTPSVTADAATVLDASAKGAGGGGTISVIAQNTAFHGTAKAQGQSGDGGSVETSGHVLDVAGARVDTTSAHGKTGTWSLDPYNVTISDAATANASGFAATGDNSIINATDLSNALATTNVVVTTGSSGSQDGDIEVASNIVWNSASSLTLKAWRNIAVDDGVTISNLGSGGLTLYADSGANSVGTVSFGSGASTALASGNLTVYYHSSDYAHPFDYTSYLVGGGSSTTFMLIDTVADLAAVNGPNWRLSHNYALNSDLDLTGYNGYNDPNLSGWVPIGSYPDNQTDTFTGIFDGQNHTISNLTIAYHNAANNGFGLFRSNDGLIENLNLSGVSISIGCCLLTSVGAVAGINGGGTISNVHASGSITGNRDVGGLVGIQYGSGAIADSSSSVNLTAAGYSRTGGLVGMNYGQITRSIATGSVVATYGGGSTGGLVGVNAGGRITQSIAMGDVALSSPTTGAGNSSFVGGFVGDNSGTITQSYATGSAGMAINDETLEVFEQNGVGSFAGVQEGAGSITQSFATGEAWSANYWTPSCSGCGWGPTPIYRGFVGYHWSNGDNGTVAGSYYDSATTGLGGGSTTADLQAALPAGWDTSVWKIIAGQSYPYLAWQFPGGVAAISGTVYSDAGTTPLAGARVSVLDNGVAVGTVTSGANGAYSILAPVGTSTDVLAYLSSGGTGNSFGDGTATSLDIWSNTLRLEGASADYSGLVSGLAAAVGGNGSGTGGLFTLSGGNTLTLSGGATLDISTHAGVFTIDKAIALNGSNLDVVADGSLITAAPITTTGVSSVALAYDVVASSGTLTLDDKITFDNLASSFSVDGHAFTLVGSLAGLATAVAANPSGLFALAHDVDAAGDGTYSASPVTTDFSGMFVGLNNTISNLTINDGTHANVGLFSHVTSSGFVVDLNLASLSVTGTGGRSNSQAVGGLAGLNEGRLSNIGVSGTIAGGDGADVGGLAGDSNGTINAVDVTNVTVSAGNGYTVGNATYMPTVGGLVGYQYGGAIQNSASSGTIGAGASSFAGGLIGYLDGATVSSSSSSGTISGGTASTIGGGVGYVTSSAGVQSVSSSATVEAGGGGIAGGLIGYNRGATYSSSASGAVTFGDGAAGGGLAGWNDGMINNSWATGTVTGSNATASQATSAGGLVGFNIHHMVGGQDVTGQIVNSYATGDVSIGNSYNSTLNAIAGGLVGTNNGALVGSHATGDVTGGTGALVGGLAGTNNSDLEDSYATGVVQGGNYASVGGLVGINYYTIGSSHASGAVSGGDGAIVGGLVGDDQASIGSLPSISGSYATGSVTVGNTVGTNLAYSGGLVGHNEASDSISASYATGTVSGGTGNAANGYPVLVGGLVGWNDGAITGSHADGAVGSGTLGHVGGFAGQNAGSIATSYASGNVTGGDQSYVGGFVGQNNGHGTITQADATGSVTVGTGDLGSGKYAFAGGFAGENEYQISYAFGSGAVNGGTGSIVGGFAGVNGAGASSGTISDSYAAGLVTAPSAYVAGGFVGATTGAATDARSYWDKTATGMLLGLGSNAFGGSSTAVGLQSGDATAANYAFNMASYVGWDFHTTWAPPTHDATNGTWYPQLYAVSRVAWIVPADAGRTYGDANPVFSGTVYGLRSGDQFTAQPTYASTATVASDVGSYAITASGAVAAGYRMIYDTATLTINPKQLTASLTGVVSKTYDGTTAATLAQANYSLAGLVTGDSVTVNDTSATYNTKDAGSGKTVTVTGVTLAGADAGNYTLASGTLSAAVGTITPATLTASLTGSVSKTYDGTTAVALAASNYTLSGIVSGDTVALNDPASGTFDTKDAGSGKTVTVTGVTLTGADAGNYTLASGTLSAAVGTITPSTLTASLTGSVSKTYDGTTAAALGASNYALSGIVSGDTVALNDPASGTFDTKDAGSGKTVTVTGVTLTGADAGNYTLASGTLSAAVGAITPATLSVAATTGSKVYGTTDPALAYTASGFADGETAAVLSGSLSRAAGENVGSYAIGIGTLSAGADYTIAFAPASFTITPAALTVAVDDASRNAGQPNPTFSATITGLVAGDTASVVSGLVFATDATTNSAPGSYAIASSGGLATNYVITQRLNGVLTVQALPSSTAGLASALSVAVVVTGTGGSTSSGGTSSGGTLSGSSTGIGGGTSGGSSTGGSIVPTTIGGGSSTDTGNSGGGSSGQGSGGTQANGSAGQGSGGSSAGQGSDGASSGQGGQGSGQGNGDSSGGLTCLVANSSASCGG